MKNVLTISLFASALLMAGTPVHDQLDARIKGKSFGGTTDDYVAASDGLGAMVLQQHTGLTEINNELITQKVFDRVLKSETDKTKTADIRTSLSTGVIGTANDKAILLNVGTELAPPSLYAFTSHTFTTCGQSGQTGPSLGQCTAAYSTDWDNDVTKFKMTTTGIQEWVVPADGSYRIEAYGAEGGDATSYSYSQGRGAIMKGTFTLTQGQVLKILVGQQPITWSYQNGGGGGTFVSLSDNTPLIVAGGGGGEGGSGGAGFDASTGTSGTNGHPGYGFGVNGYGVTNDNNGGWGQSGSGFYGNGGGWCSSTYYCSNSRAQAFVNGGNGSGYSANSSYRSSGSSCHPAPGSFGGGGSGACNGAGGGGGYSGGGQGGGGGGSYNSGSDQSNSVGNTGAGKVIITKL